MAAVAHGIECHKLLVRLLDVAVLQRDIPRLVELIKRRDVNSRARATKSQTAVVAHLPDRPEHLPSAGHSDRIAVHDEVS